jgi:hypothetical protein
MFFLGFGYISVMRKMVVWQVVPAIRVAAHIGIFSSADLL